MNDELGQDVLVIILNGRRGSWSSPEGSSLFDSKDWVDAFSLVASADGEMMQHHVHNKGCGLFKRPKKDNNIFKGLIYQGETIKVDADAEWFDEDEQAEAWTNYKINGGEGNNNPLDAIKNLLK